MGRPCTPVAHCGSQNRIGVRFLYLTSNVLVNASQGFAPSVSGRWREGFHKRYCILSPPAKVLDREGHDIGVGIRRALVCCSRRSGSSWDTGSGPTPQHFLCERKHNRHVDQHLSRRASCSKHDVHATTGIGVAPQRRCERSRQRHCRRICCPSAQIVLRPGCPR